MYNEKDWEKNHEPLNGENDVDITEGSYVDGRPHRALQRIGAQARMYARSEDRQKKIQAAERISMEAARARKAEMRAAGRRRRTAGTRKTAATLTEAERKEAGWLRKRPGSRPPDCCLAAWQAEPWRESIT